jgi:hypothetical protein
MYCGFEGSKGGLRKQENVKYGGAKYSFVQHGVSVNVYCFVGEEDCV